MTTKIFLKWGQLDLDKLLFLPLVLSKVAVNVSAKMSTSFNAKIFGVTFEVSKFLSARTFELQR